MGTEAGVQAYRPTQEKEVKSMEASSNGSVRLTRRQVQQLATTVANVNADEVDLSIGVDGRLLVKQVIKTEKLKALPLSK
jgi:hypothetical protein